MIKKRILNTWIKQKLLLRLKNILVEIFANYLAYKVKEKSWKKLSQSVFVKKYRIIYLDSGLTINPYCNNNIYYFNRNKYENLVHYFDVNEKLFFLNNKHEIAYVLRYLKKHHYKIYVNKD